MAKKITGESDIHKDKILKKLEEAQPVRYSSENLVDTSIDDYGKN